MAMKPNGDHQGGAVIYAKNPERVASFYRRVAGLRLCRAVRSHVVLDSGAFQLVVLRIPARLAKRIAIESPPRRRENAAIKPVFFVTSITQARELARNYGGALNELGREWRFDGMTVCDGSDPEGNIFQLRAAAAKAKKTGQTARPAGAAGPRG